MKESPLNSLDILFSGGFSAYLKDESVNPSGTIKDRRNQYIISRAEALHVDKLVIITSGNNGYSLGNLAKRTNIKVVCIIDKNAPTRIKKNLLHVCYDVIELNLHSKYLLPEDTVHYARENDQEVIWDVTNGYEEGYEEVIKEIYAKITPDYIVVPIGSGGIFFAFAEKTEQLNLPTKIIGIDVQQKSNSIADKLSNPWPSPYEKSIENFKRNGHKVFTLSETEIKQAYNKFKRQVNCEPSSAVVFAAPDKFKFESSDKVVFLNTGNGLV
jgi:threonine synthase